MLNTNVNKAVYGFLAGLVALVALFVPTAETWFSPELLQGVASLIAAFVVVYAVPNAPKR